MTINELIVNLQNDLRNELTHLHFYLQSAALVQGLHAKDIKDILTKLNSRLDTIEQKINYLYENNSPVFAAVLEDEKED